MSAGQGSSTDPIKEDDEKEEEDLIKQLSQMTVDELPEDLQKLIFEYKFKAEIAEERKQLLDYIYDNQHFLIAKERLQDIYNNLYHDFILGDVMHDYDDTETQLNILQNAIRKIGEKNDALLTNYEEGIQNYMRYTFTYKNNHRFG